MRPAATAIHPIIRRRATRALAVTLAVVSAASCTSGGSARTSGSTTGSTTPPSASVPATSTTAVASATSTASDQGWIAYQAAAGLSLVRPDGTEAHTLLPRGSSNPHHPDWAPDGRRLAYTTDEADGTSDIWIVDRDGANQHRLVDCQAPCVYADDPAWSPDGTQIAYWTDTSTQVIGVVDAATGAVVVEIPAGDLEGPVGPRWSPDGRRLVVEVGRYAAEGDGFKEVASALGIIDLTVAEPMIQAIPTPDLLFPGTRIGAPPAIASSSRRAMRTSMPMSARHRTSTPFDRMARSSRRSPTAARMSRGSGCRRGRPSTVTRSW